MRPRFHAVQPGSRVKMLATAVMLSGGLAGAAGLHEVPPFPAGAIRVVPHAARPVTAGAAANFTGPAQVEQLFGARDRSQVTGGIVTFEPGARSVWHTHPLGQILIVTAGSGLVQQWGQPAHPVRAGDVVWIPAGVKHWHGASAAASLTHIAVQQMRDGRVVDWMEPVTEAQFAAANRSP